MSGEQPVPTTEEVREYVAVGGEPRPWEAPDAEADERRAAAFDRWLSAHDSEVATRNYALGQQDPVRALPDREAILAAWRHGAIQRNEALLAWLRTDEVSGGPEGTAEEWGADAVLALLRGEGS